MARTLDVYLYQKLVGHLIQDDGGQMVFGYGESWLNMPGAMPLSQSLPLRKKRFTRKECRGFFAGILPEESKREIIARNLGISARNDYAMLEQIGGECAGAVTFIPAGEALPESNYSYRTLTSAELATILKELPKRPLLAGEEGMRLSLAGAQDKIPVRIANDNLSLPLGGAPSTHILKPAVKRFEGVVSNEAFCMQLAAAIGLSVAAVQTRTVEGTAYLLVERYDRVYRQVAGAGEVTGIERLHQEDFCQAQGIVSETKYQKEGGPSLKQCFGLLREVSSTPVIDLARLLDAVIYNYLVGNNDAHGKNFSLMYHETGNLEVSLAPLYDIVCTVCYPELSQDMAMKIGGEYSSEKVMPQHFAQLAQETGLAKPIVRRRVPELAGAILSTLPKMEITDLVTETVASLIQKRCENTQNNFISK